PFSQIPKMELAAVLAAEKQFRVQSLFEHVRRAPLAGHHCGVAKVPPEIVSQVLGAAFHLPLTENIEREVIEQEDASRPVAVSRSESADVDALGPTVDCVKSRVVYASEDFFRFNDPHDLRLARIGVGVAGVQERG